MPANSPRTKDITGLTFNRLTAEKFIRVDGRRRAVWLFRCTCGTTKELPAVQVRALHIKSCGCALREVQSRGTYRHGKSKTPTWKAWVSMRTRCSRETGIGWKDYRADGVRVCERWAVFENFLADMGERPEGTSLDRLDNSKGYEPGNCRWALLPEQYENKSNTVVVTFHGLEVPFIQLVRLSGVAHSTAYARMFRYGWTAERAFPQLQPEKLKRR